jgi:lipoprotein-releasing system permease protein
MIFLALKHLISRKRQSFFTLVGIFFGTAAFVIISGFFGGFKNYLTDQLVSNDAHIKVTKNDEKTNPETIALALKRDSSEHINWIRKPNPRLNVSEIKDPQGWVKKIKSTPGVIAVGFQYSTTALITKAGISQSANLVGTEPEAQAKITNIESKMIKGNFLELKKGLDLLVIGQTLSEDLGVSVDDVVAVTSSNNIVYPMKVVGIFSSGNRAGDRGTAYTSLSTAQKIGGQNGKINQISVTVNDHLKAGVIANQWKASSRDKVESWDQANSGFLSIFKTQDLMRYATTSILLLVAGFGIYNILSMVVMQKRKDIAILRSMGFDHQDVLILFLLQGIILGCLGSILGTGIGFLVCKWLTTLTMSTPESSVAMNVNISFNLSIYLQALFLGIGASCIAAYLPSRSAANMTPIDIIRAGAE